MVAVNENTTSFLTVSFFDELGNAVVPTAATYRIDDPDGTSIVDATAMTLAEVVEITITSNQNRILHPTNPFETRIVTVEFDYSGGTKHGTHEDSYEIRNLAFL